MAASTCSSLYEVLGIPMNASVTDIKAAYRRLARTCHPDVVAMPEKERSANDFKKIYAAYSTLSDPSKRASYDRDLFRMWSFSGAGSVHVHRSSGSGISNPRVYSNYSTRANWETDQCW